MTTKKRSKEREQSMAQLPKEAEAHIEAITAEYARQTDEQLQMIDRLQHRIDTIFACIYTFKAQCEEIVDQESGLDPQKEHILEVQIALLQCILNKIK